MPKQITRENWEQSENKWVKIVIKTKGREGFIFRNHFTDLPVSEKCGYCNQFYGIYGYCSDCPLYKKNICANENDESDVLFYKYLDEMNKIFDSKKVNWKRALDYAIKILSAIREDKPPKEPA